MPKVLQNLKDGNKGVVIYGPRQAGKTTLVEDTLAQLGGRVARINGDQRGSWQDVILSREIGKLGGFLADYDVLFVDEAQRIPEIGLTLKIILDNFKRIKVVATGSSSLDLASKIGEPLTGRVWTYKLFPVSWGELKDVLGLAQLEDSLEERLIFGSYPELFSTDGLEAKAKYLKDLTDAYLYKDLLEFSGIRNSGKIRDLLKLLAFQVGSQVSLSELAKSLEISKDTVARYIDLLEKSFVVFRLKGFNRNLRKEVVKMDKIFFYDLGVRNTLIGNLNFLSSRDDAGQLWENFLVVERMKAMEYAERLYSHYFWRLTSGAELDLIEEKGGKLTGYEFKWGGKMPKEPKSWVKTYKTAGFMGVNRDNYHQFTTAQDFILPS